MPHPEVLLTPKLPKPRFLMEHFKNLGSCMHMNVHIIKFITVSVLLSTFALSCSQSPQFFWFCKM